MPLTRKMLRLGVLFSFLPFFSLLPHIREIELVKPGYLYLTHEFTIPVKMLQDLWNLGSTDLRQLLGKGLNDKETKPGMKWCQNLM